MTGWPPAWWEIIIPAARKTSFFRWGSWGAFAPHSVGPIIILLGWVSSKVQRRAPCCVLVFIQLPPVGPVRALSGFFASQKMSLSPPQRLNKELLWRSESVCVFLLAPPTCDCAARQTDGGGNRDRRQRYLCLRCHPGNPLRCSGGFDFICSKRREWRWTELRVVTWGRVSCLFTEETVTGSGQTRRLQLADPAYLTPSRTPSLRVGGKIPRGEKQQWWMWWKTLLISNGPHQVHLFFSRNSSPSWQIRTESISLLKAVYLKFILLSIPKSTFPKVYFHSPTTLIQIYLQITNKYAKLANFKGHFPSFFNLDVIF